LNPFSYLTNQLELDMSDQDISNQTNYHVISGRFAGERVATRILEEQIQEAVAQGHRVLQIDAYGQHGIGGRLWQAGDEPINIQVVGQPGQRLGSMGFPNTSIEVLGPASDDVGWLNAGSEIVIHGNAGNGCANAMAQGKIFISGNIGARGMTMTKHNPRFDPPETPRTPLTFSVIDRLSAWSAARFFSEGRTPVTANPMPSCFP
jgi:glutamate synthase domain-containing protein 3